MEKPRKIDGIEGIAFDLDGTLYPNYRFNLLLLPFIFKNFRLLAGFGKARKIIRARQTMPDFTPFADNSFYSYQARITAEILGKSSETQPVSAMQDKIDALIYKAWEPMFKKVKLYKNAVTTLKAFKDSGFKLALMSDFPAETKLENLGLIRFPGTQTDIWDVVHCSEHCGAIKPHPLPFIKLADSMSLPPQKILYIGNSYSYDVAGAAGAGMKTAWIKSRFLPGKRPDKPKADFVFNNYRQLHDFMLK